MEPFHFFTERRLVQLTGVTARSLPELLTSLDEIPGSCIFYHTHHLFLSHHFEKPVVYNDFANWCSEALLEEALSERLAAIDLLSLTTIRRVREQIISIIRNHMGSGRWRLRECPPGDEFHFCKSMSFIMPTGIVAYSVPEFFAKLHSITNVSLYFHLLEARLRLERSTNDFSFWLRGCGEPRLADEIDRLDPYSYTLDEIKEQIIELGAAHGTN
jgi:hypothetical protein